MHFLDRILHLPGADPLNWDFSKTPAWTSTKKFPIKPPMNLEFSPCRVNQIMRQQALGACNTKCLPDPCMYLLFRLLVRWRHAGLGRTSPNLAPLAGYRKEFYILDLSRVAFVYSGSLTTLGRFPPLSHNELLGQAIKKLTKLSQDTLNPGQSDFIYLKVRAHQGIRPTQGAPWLPMDCCIAFEQTFRVFEIDRHSVAPALHPQYNGSYDHLRPPPPPPPPPDVDIQLRQGQFP
ncbi:hypothetical protein MCOR24_003111 [Pyricularia oryzae]|nr:hypothetical protein MCOR24_003111 [Pyricularia oryzae]